MRSSRERALHTGHVCVHILLCPTQTCTLQPCGTVDMHSCTYQCIPVHTCAYLYIPVQAGLMQFTHLHMPVPGMPRGVQFHRVHPLSILMQHLPPITTHAQHSRYTAVTCLVPLMTAAHVECIHAYVHKLLYCLSLRMDMLYKEPAVVVYGLNSEAGLKEAK